MKKLPLIVGISACTIMSATSYAQLAASTGYCELGATQALTQGAKSANYLQGIVPRCTVTVHLAGTQTLATISSNTGGTQLSNPFTASTLGGWTFYSAAGTAIDITLSGGTSPNNYITPVTIPNVTPGGGGGGGGNTGPQGHIAGYTGANGALGSTGGTVDSTTNILFFPTANSQVSNGLLSSFQYSTSAGDTGVTAAITAQPPAWQASHAYALNATIFDGVHIQKVTTAGTSGATLPLFTGTSTTADGSVVWTNTGVGIPDIQLETTNTGTTQYPFPTNQFGLGAYIPLPGLVSGTHLVDHRSTHTPGAQFDSNDSDLEYQPGQWSQNWVSHAFGSIFGYNQNSTGHGGSGGIGSEQDNFTFNSVWFGAGMNPGNNWDTGKNVSLATYNFKMGIHQALGSYTLCMALGDCVGGGGYHYLFANSGSPDSSGEGVTNNTNEVTLVSQNAAAPATATSAGATSVSMHYTIGLPSAGTYLAYDTAPVEYNVTGGGSYGGGHVWSQYYNIASVAGSTLPNVSNAHAVIASCNVTGPSALPITRTCTLTTDGTVGSGMFTTGLACFSGRQVESVSITAGGTTSVTFNSTSEIIGNNEELWQGGPCGQGVASLNGSSIAEWVATSNYSALPIVGSPSTGVIAINSTFLGGQQGPGSGFGAPAPTIVYSGVSFTRTSNVVTITFGGSPIAPLTLPLGTQPIITVATGDSSFNTTLPHTTVFQVAGTRPETTVSPFTQTPGESIGDLINSAYSATYPQTGANASTTGTITYTGVGHVMMMPIAKIRAVGSQTATNVFPLTLDPNSLPSIGTSTTITQSHYWYQHIDNQVLFGNDNGMGASIFNGSEYTCTGFGACITAVGSSDPRIIPFNLITATGLFNNIFSVPAPTQGQSTTYTNNASLINVGCPGAGIYGCYGDGSGKPIAPSQTYNFANIQVYGGNDFELVNYISGARAWGDKFGTWLLQSPAGSANPFATSQTLAADGSQSQLFPKGIVGRKLQIMSGGFVLTTDFETLSNGGNSTLTQPIAVGPIADQSFFGGNATGEIDAGTNVSNFSSQSADVIAGLPIPIVDGGNSPGTMLRITTYTGPVGTNFRSYYLTGVGVYGETSLGDQVSYSNQAMTLTSSITNLLTCPTYLQQSTYSSYNLYVDDGNATGVYKIGGCPVGSTVLDTGAIRIGGVRGASSRNLSGPLEGAQVNLFGHGVGWLASVAAGSGYSGQLNQTSAGQFSLDTTTFGNAAASLNLGPLTATSLSTSTPTTGTTCTVGGFITLVIDGTSRKVAYCN